MIDRQRVDNPPVGRHSMKAIVAFGLETVDGTLPCQEANFSLRRRIGSIEKHYRENKSSFKKIIGYNHHNIITFRPR